MKMPTEFNQPVANRGFTLLEILVALAIAAVGLAAVSQSMVGSTRMAQAAEDRLVAAWVASNRMAEIRLDRVSTTRAQRTTREKMAGREWFMEEKYTKTADPEIVRVDINVYTDPDHDSRAATLFAYLAAFKLSPPS